MRRGRSRQNGSVTGNVYSKVDAKAFGSLKVMSTPIIRRMPMRH
jgi:hypothetical protein